MIIFLYGDDAFSSRGKVAQIKQKYLDSDKSGSGLSVFDCDEEKMVVKKISGVIGTPNLLSPKRLVIVKSFIESYGVEEQKELLGFLKKKEKTLLDDKDVVVIFWEVTAPKKSGTLFKFLEKKTKSQKFEKLTGVKLRQWVLREIAEIDKEAKISSSALEKLIVYCAEDLFTIHAETQKLVNFADGKMIEESDVELLVNAKLGGNIFQMVDALGSNNKKEALSLLHKHLEKGDDPFYIMSMFFYQFRNMLKVADLKEKGFPEYEIASISKLHPFVVKKSMAQTARFGLPRLKEIYDKLSLLDSAVKTGQIEIVLGLDKFVGEL